MLLASTYLPSGRRPVLLFLSFFAVSALFHPSDAEAQWPWSYTVVVPAYTPAPSSAFNALSGTCKEQDGTTSSTIDVPDGGYIKTNTTLTTDVWVYTTGQCERRIFGSFYDYEYHHISFVRVQQLQPGADPSNPDNWAPGYVFLRSPSFILNSIPGTTTNPNPPPPDNTTPAVSLGVHTEGEHRFRYRTTANVTSCNFPYASPEADKTLNALACLPNWKASGEYGTYPSEVTVVYPTSLKGPAEAAIAGLNARSPGGLQFVPSENGTYTPSDERYIVITEIGSCPIVGDACGCNDHGNPVNGVLTTASYVYVPLASRTQGITDAFRAFVISHEMTHLLGLNHSDGPCSVMNTVPGACGTMAEGQATVATFSDATPVTKSIYGTTPRKTCGW